MNSIRHILLVAATVLLTAPFLNAQASESAINKQLEKLRALNTQQRPAATIKLAADIRTLPAGAKKVDLANNLASRVTEGDQGAAALQAVADALSQALAESPVPAKGDQPPAAYLELASLVRYKNVTTTLKDPLFVKAGQVLIANDADVEKADFTLKDLHNKKVTLSELRGKIVVVNFWATWCSACRAEMPALDAFYAAHRAEGLKLIGVSVDRRRARDSVQQVAQTLHYPIGMLGEADVNGFGEPSVLPMTYVIDRQGRVAAVLTPGQSEVEERTLSAAVLPLLARTR